MGVGGVELRCGTERVSCGCRGGAFRCCVLLRLRIGTLGRIGRFCGDGRWWRGLVGDRRGVFRISRIVRGRSRRGSGGGKGR